MAIGQNKKPAIKNDELKGEEILDLLYSKIHEHATINIINIK